MVSRAHFAHDARMTQLSRRSFKAGLPIGLSIASSAGNTSAAASDEIPSSFPTGSRARPRNGLGRTWQRRSGEGMVGRNQTLAKASYDCGFGDWETALGAASHVGNREIAEFFLANEARPTIFSAAMLGQLDAVKAFVTASPGVQKIKGPHSITLLRHAAAGGAAAKPVAEYLTAIGGADERITEQPLSAEEKAKLAGTYAFGSAARDRMEVTVNKDALMIARRWRPARTASPRVAAVLSGGRRERPDPFC
jgi:hypothetical protein